MKNEKEKEEPFFLKKKRRVTYRWVPPVINKERTKK